MGSAVAAHGASCSASCGIFLDQGSNPRPLHWQEDSQPLRHQGSPVMCFYVYVKVTGVKEHCSCRRVGFTAPTTTPNLNGFTQYELISRSCHSALVVSRTLCSGSFYTKPWRSQTPFLQAAGRVGRVKQESFLSGLEMCMSLLPAWH